jgi:hypothetical protein
MNLSETETRQWLAVRAQPQRAALKAFRRAAVRENVFTQALQLGAPAATLAGHYPVNAVVPLMVPKRNWVPSGSIEEIGSNR